MFANESLTRNIYPLEGINEREANVLKGSYNYSGIFNSRTLVPENYLKSDTILMLSFLNLLRIANNRNDFQVNIESFNYRDVEAGQRYLRTYSTRGTDGLARLNIVHFSTGIIKGIQYIDAWATPTWEVYLEESLRIDDRHIIKVYRKDTRIVILTNVYTDNFQRKILALIPILFKYEQLTEPIMKILLDYGASDYLEWIRSMNSWLENSDLYNQVIANGIKEYFKANLKNRETELRREILEIKGKINDYANALGNKYAELEVKNNEMNTLVTTDTYEEQTKDLLNYFNNNNIVTLNNIEGDNLYFTITAPIRYYDVTPLKRYIKKGSMFTEQQAMLIDEVFIKGKYKLQCATTVRLNSRHNSVSNTDRFTLPTGYLPHPHLMQYNCFGSNSAYIAEALSNKNLILAIEQLVASHYNFAFTDNTVTGSFINRIFGTDWKDKKIFTDNDGNKYSVTDILATRNVEVAVDEIENPIENDSPF